jgi:hypothetical protein
MEIYTLCMLLISVQKPLAGSDFNTFLSFKRRSEAKCVRRLTCNGGSIPISSCGGRLYLEAPDCDVHDLYDVSHRYKQRCGSATKERRE